MRSVSRHSSRYRMVWITVISGTGVILLKPKRSLSRHMGRYLSKRIIRLAFSDCTLRRSIQLLTTLRRAEGRLRPGRVLGPPSASHRDSWIEPCLKQALAN